MILPVARCRWIRKSAVPIAVGMLALTGAADARAQQQGNATVSGGNPSFFEGMEFPPRPPVQPLRPDEQVNQFLLQPGYRLEPVLTDPDIEQPGAIAFDANGRMYVLELRTYMLDADSRDQLQPWSRISRWEDTDGDGVFDHGTVFVDSLIFPRFVTPLGDGVILTKNSNDDNVWMYTDTDGDGVADERELFATGFGRSANVEHQEAWLTWGMDNWLYATYQPVRLRWTPDGVLREPIGNPGGAWGVTQDDDGKIHIQGGASGAPGYFQFPIHYGSFSHPDQLAPELRTTWGAPLPITDMQGGVAATRMPDRSLARSTAGAGAEVFRGHRLPEELRGHYFYGEAVARIVRRIAPTKHEGLTQMQNYYHEERSEFIRSLDPLFRPVGMRTGPDGTLYIVDMYHGIIQEGNWAQPGSYLRARIEQYGLDRIIKLGRIWRLTYEGMEPDPVRPRMYDETTAELVRHLEHPNGWWRDMAQQQMVLRQDRSVAPELRAMARSHGSLVTRFHALWTLEGLGELDVALVRELFADPNPRMRIQALRASETLYKAGRAELAEDYFALTRDADPEVVTYAMLTLNVLRVPNAEEAIRAVRASNTAAGPQFVAERILDAPPATASSGATPEQAARFEAGERIYQQLCTECHGNMASAAFSSGEELVAPPLLNDRVTGSQDYVVQTLLHGLTGPIDGREYAGGLMIAMGATQDDEWVAAIASYIRNAFTNTGSFVSPEDVARIRAASATRTSPWTYEELLAAIPAVIEPDARWRVTASHARPTRIGNTGDPRGAFTFEGWTTGEPQAPGMWFAVDMQEPKSVTAIEFTAQGGGGGQTTTAPRAYRLETSLDGANWTTLVEGSGAPGINRISFDPVLARHLRITQTAESVEGGPAWSVMQMRIYGPGSE